MFAIVNNLFLHKSGQKSIVSYKKPVTPHCNHRNKIASLKPRAWGEERQWYATNCGAQR